MTTSEISVLYITRVDIFLNAAQSLQIQKMASSFNKQSKNFQLIYHKSTNTDQNLDYALPIKAKSHFRLLAHLYFYLKSLKYIFGKKYDIIFTRDIAVVLLCIILRKRCAYEVHHDFEGILGKFIFQLCKDSSCLKLIFISAGAMKGFKKLYNFKTDFLICHDGYDPSIFEPKPIYDNDFELFIRNFKIVLIHCGGFSILKGADKIYDIVKNYPNFGFVQIGDATGASNSQDLLFELRTMNNFHYINRLHNSDVGYYLKKATVLFFPMNKDNPYWWCTSPLKLVEYLASGRVILGSFEGSSRELITETQIIEFDPYSTKDMHDKLENLSTFLPLFYTENEQLKKNTKIFTWDQRVDRILDFLGCSID